VLDGVPPAMPLEGRVPSRRCETVTKMESQNKAIASQAFDTLFDKRDYAAAACKGGAKGAALRKCADRGAREQVAAISVPACA
jgi:hypothetical protein